MTSSVEAQRRDVAKRSGSSVSRVAAGRGDIHEDATKDIGFSGVMGREMLFIGGTLLCVSPDELIACGPPFGANEVPN